MEKTGFDTLSLDFAFNISGLISKHPLFFIGAPKSVIVNRQIGVVDSKYVVVFDPLPIGHAI